MPARSAGRREAVECSIPIEVANSCVGNCGDCNSDGSVSTVLDVLLAAQNAAGIFRMTAAELICCDIDSSLDVDILDALRLGQAAAGLPVSLGCP